MSVPCEVYGEFCPKSNSPKYCKAVMNILDKYIGYEYIEELGGSISVSDSGNEFGGDYIDSVLFEGYTRVSSFCSSACITYNYWGGDKYIRDEFDGVQWRRSEGKVVYYPKEILPIDVDEDEEDNLEI